MTRPALDLGRIFDPSAVCQGDLIDSPRYQIRRFESYSDAPRLLRAFRELLQGTKTVKGDLRTTPRYQSAAAPQRPSTSAGSMVLRLVRVPL